MIYSSWDERDSVSNVFKINLGNSLILLALAVALFFAVVAIIRGYKGMKISKIIH